jgi:outer membrane protein OmpA-like peptidoglycan-associated protein
MASEVLILLLASLAQAASSPPAPEWLTCSSYRTREGGIRVVDQFAHVYFDSGSARIDEQGAATLDRYAAYVQPPPNCHVIIAGHADMVGRPEANLELSRRRAEAVDAYLRARGVTGPISIEFFGETRPMVETPDGTPEPENRRVEVFVSQPPTP